MLAQAMALQQTDHGQRQQDDQRQVARLDKARANGGQHLVDGKARGKCRSYGRDDHDQHGVKAQREAGNDDEHANQRPQIDISRHVDLRKQASRLLQNHLRAAAGDAPVAVRSLGLKAPMFNVQQLLGLSYC